MAAGGTGRATGVGTLEVAIGVTARDERGLLFDLGLAGACKKSSGISFHCPDAGAAVVVDVGAERTRTGAEADLGGGGGRLGADSEIGGGFVV